MMIPIVELRRRAKLVDQHRPKARGSPSTIGKPQPMGAFIPWRVLTDPPQLIATALGISIIALAASSRCARCRTNWLVRACFKRFRPI